MAKTSSVLSKNNPREIFGWIMYDWANAVFFTTTVSVLLPNYITLLAQKAVGENGVVLSFGGYWEITAKSLFPFAVGVSVLGQVFFLPLLGGIADYTQLKKFFLGLFCYIGVIASCLLFFVQGNLYLLGCLLFIISNLCAGASIVFYNAFLPDICTEDKRDKVSSWSFAAGYLSASLVLVGNFILIVNAEKLGISDEMAKRICLLIAGIWWGLFALFTFRLLKQRGVAQPIPAGQNYFTIGFTELVKTFREFARLRHTLKFLIAYLLYSDGIQTVITQSSVFLGQELFVVRGLEPDTAFLVQIFLVAQVFGLIGAILFEFIARFIGTKYSILLSLLIWCGIVIYCYGFLYTTFQAWFVGAAIGLVLGSSQALSRSLFSEMIPQGREASFFGIYEISERGTSWLGPIVFGLVVQLTNSYRPAILALIVFFIVGSVILFFTDTKKAILEAGQHLPEETTADHS